MSFDKYLQDGQEPKVIEKIYNKITDMLSSGEAISYIALQKKPAVTLLPDSITITNRRIFLCEFTKLGLSTNFEIFAWKEIKDIAFKEEIFGSKVTVIPFTGENLTVDYIPKIQARKLYQLIKEALQNVNEEDNLPIKEVPTRPIFNPVVPIKDIYEEPTEETTIDQYEDANVVTSEASIEKVAIDPQPINTQEKITIETPTPIASTPPIHSNTDEEDELTLKLRRLKNLFDKQLITQAEYESKKAEILSQL